MTAPGYWRYEQGGVLRPVVEAYLRGEQLTAVQVRIMRHYLRQWIDNGYWRGPQVERLRDSLESMTNHAQVRTWLAYAIAEGIDPL